MRHSRTDANQKDLVKELRRRGFLVAVTSDAGDGFPDLVIGWRDAVLLNRPKGLALIELKDGNKVPSEQRLTPAQVKFHDDWKGAPVYVCNSLMACLAAIQDAGG